LKAAKVSGERAAKASGESGDNGRESADLSSEEPNMNGTRNYV
jgi:hypothetical protein